MKFEGTPLPNKPVVNPDALQEPMTRREFLKLGAQTAATAAVLGEAIEHTVDDVQRYTNKEFFSPGETPQVSLDFSTEGYADQFRVTESNYRHLKPEELPIRPLPLVINNLSLSGRLEGAGLKGIFSEIRDGKIERSLRFKNITDAVERRYNLPPGIILSMVMQESSGADMFPNAGDDGGIGLCHMQPAVAAEFGLSIYGNNRRMVDREHGRGLRQLIASEDGNIFRLSEHDDRFNRLLNLDAVGRMLATHMSGPLIGELGPLRSAIRRYAGKYNYPKYVERMKTYLSNLYNPDLLAKIEENFNRKNEVLRINGKTASDSGSAFLAYLQAFWDENRIGFGLDEYEKLSAYEPPRSNDVLETYRRFFLS